MVGRVRGTWERFAVREKRGGNHALARTLPRRRARRPPIALFARPLRPIQGGKIRVCLRSFEIGERGW